MQYINPPIILRPQKRNGGLYPAAHFCVYGIYIITNNAVSVKYIPHHSFISYNPIFALRVPQNVTAHYIAPQYITSMQFTSPPTTVCT